MNKKFIPVFFKPARFPVLILIFFVVNTLPLFSQGVSQDIYSDYVLFQKRARLDKDLRENIVAKTFNEKLDSNNEHKFESAFLAISEFLFDGQGIKDGFNQLFTGYNWLQPDTRRAFLEAVYAVYPDEYYKNIESSMPLKWTGMIQ